MAKFSVEKVRAMMDVASNIRNISVIAHVDHGKSTLTDSLVSRAGIIAEKRAGDMVFMQGRADEQKRGITIKSTSVSLYYEREEEKGEQTRYLVNLIDSPGHVDFSSEVTAALRVTDGALVVVDCIEGVCVQTETVLRQAIGERIKPVLFLNKLDRVFLEIQPTLEECYLSMRKSIESVNVVCQTYKDEKLGFIELLPETGRVGFGSGLHAWGFTLMDFGKMYASKFGLSTEKMMQKLWGDNYWDPVSKEWVKKPLNDKMMRGFCQFVLHPIKKLFDSVMSGKKEEYSPLLKALRLKINKKDMEEAKKPKDLMKLIMRTWIPAGKALLDMIVMHLPSPVEAQKYRVENLYSGPLDSLDARAVRECDPKGPTSMYVSKMVPWTDNGRFLAFGRVFSGTIRTGQEIRILGPDYEPGHKKDLHVKKIQRCMLMMGRYSEPIFDCPAGNVCGLLGVDEFLLKSGTLTDSETFAPFHTMKFSVAAVVQVAVTTKNATDLPKLVEGLKRLSKSDQIVKISTSKSGENIVSGAGELHLEICLKDLREEFMNNAEIVVSEPIVSFSETISQNTGDDKRFPTICIAKSPNRHNRLFVSASPLSEAFVKGIEEGTIHTGKVSDLTTYARELANKYGWDVNDAKKIWTYGCPPDGLPNVVVDATKGVQFLHEIQELVGDAFREVTKSGVLCGEVLRGVRYNLIDCTLHADGVHRGPGQIIPCAKKVFYGCQLASGPKLLEPMYLVEITVSMAAQSGVYATLNARRGEVVDIQERPGTPLSVIRAHLPVLDSFGFTQLLRENTGGKAFPQMKFSHWKEMPGDPMKEGTPAYIAVMKTRKRKGMKEELPIFNDYYDKLQK